VRYIADANVLLPLLAAGHAHRAPALAWWNQCTDADVGLCLLVQMALLRLLTNAKVMGSNTLPPGRAWEVVDQLLGDPRILVIKETPQTHTKFWQANISRREASPNLWTDAWLAAMAQGMDCEIATFDRGFLSFPKLRLLLLDPVVS
jgi:toxin-antitoxin system PIN domain toxin